MKTASLNNLKLKLIIAFTALTLLFAAFGAVSLKRAFADENLLESYNLTLSDDLTVNFYANEKVGAGAYIKVAIDGVEGEKTIYAEEDNAYKFSCTDLAPQLMSRTLTATLFNASDEEKGSAETTLAKYCKDLIDKGAAGNKLTDGKFEALKTLIVDLLSYGAEAQTYIKDGGEKCNAFLSEGDYSSLTGGTYALPSAASFTTTAVDDTTKLSVKPTTAQVFLDYNIVAKITFEVNGLTVDGVKATADGLTVEAKLSQKATDNENVTEYTAIVPLSVLDVSKQLSVTLLSAGKAVGWTVKGSVAGYLAKRNATEESDKTLAEKLYSYAKSAFAYANTLYIPSAETATYILEAENADMSGVTLNANYAFIKESSNASGGKYLQNFWAQNGTFTYSVYSETEAKASIFFYTAHSGSTFDVSSAFGLQWNGSTFTTTAETEKTSGYETFVKTYIATVSLEKGLNTLSLTKKSNFANLDYIAFDVNNPEYMYPVTIDSEENKTYTYEAENADLSTYSLPNWAINNGKTKVESSAGASGGKNLGCLSSSTGYIDFTIYSKVEGTVTLYLQVANGSGSTIALSNAFTMSWNQTAIATNATAESSSWTTWQKVELTTVSLKQGVNTFRITFKSTAPNLDCIYFEVKK